jgi:hypothetical protein
MSETINKEVQNLKEKKQIKVKRFRSAYILFYAEILKKLNKNPKFADCTKKMQIIADIWKNLSLEEKENYFKLEKEDKKRYLEEIEKLGNLDNKNKRNSLLINKPIKNKSAREFYLEENSSNLSCAKNNYEKVKQKREILLKWETLNEEDKKVYEMKAEEDEKRYKEEFLKYQSDCMKFNSKLEKRISFYEKKVLSICKEKSEFNNLESFIKKYSKLLNKERKLKKLIKTKALLQDKRMTKRFYNLMEKLKKMKNLQKENTNGKIFEVDQKLDKKVEKKSNVLYDDLNKYINSKYKITDKKKKILPQNKPGNHKNSNEKNESIEYYSIEEENSQHIQESDSESNICNFSDIIEESDDEESDKQFFSKFLSRKRQKDNFSNIPTNHHESDS